MEMTVQDRASCGPSSAASDSEHGNVLKSWTTETAPCAEKLSMFYKVVQWHTSGEVRNLQILYA